MVKSRSKGPAANTGLPDRKAIAKKTPQPKKPQSKKIPVLPKSKDLAVCSCSRLLHSLFGVVADHTPVLMPSLHSFHHGS